MEETNAVGDRELDNWARKLSDALDRSAQMRANEQELREDVHGLIQQAAQELYGLSDLATTAERRAGGSARQYDRLYGGLAVEWEWDMGAPRRRKGAEQALDYLELLRSGVEDVFSAVVCDGKQWGFLISDAPQSHLALGDAPDPPPEERFQWQPNSRAACRRFLSLIGSNEKRPVSAQALAVEFGQGSATTRKAITLLVEAIAARSLDDRADTLYREWYRSLDVVYDNLQDPDGKLAIVLRDAYGITARQPLGELLFCVHTYFALVARLVAIEVLALSIHDPAAQPSLWASDPDDALGARLRAVDAGEVPASLHIQNLFEGDVFSWYLDALPGNVELLNAARDLLGGIGHFAFPRLAFGANPATDVLRDLYQQLLPRQLRGALGEFLTPPWLAEACLERLNTIGAPVREGRVLDPTCGTATFLIPVLSARAATLRARESEPTAGQVQDLLDTVVGFDLNPVAVIAARVNYVVALGDLAAVGDLTLPLWRADSILVPDAPAGQTDLSGGRLTGRPWQALRTSLVEPFPVPPPLANARSMPALRRLLDDGMREPDPSSALTAFQVGLDREFGPDAPEPVASSGRAWEDVREVAIELYERIRKLRDADRNGVWARIIENSFAPLFAGTFDVVVGNPPWLAWNKMPESWRKAGEVYWKRYGLWRPPPEQGKRGMRPQIGDIATLVYATAVERYAKRHGYVGLLVPRSLAIGDPGGRAFRQFRLQAAADDVGEVGYGPQLNFRPLHCDDWGQLNPFAPDASNKPIFLVARTHEAGRYPVPTSRWERAAAGAHLGPTWTNTRGQLREVVGQSNPVNRAVTTSSWSFQADGTIVIEGGTNDWPFGLGLNTRGANGVFFVSVLSSRPDATGRVEIVNDPAAGRDSRVKARQGRVEAVLVYPVMRGEEVHRWTAQPDGHIIVPYRQNAMGQVISGDEMTRSYPEADRWLRAFGPILRERKIIASMGWEMSGDDWCQVMGPLEFMDGRPIVVVREMAKRPAAAVVLPRYDAQLGRTATVLIDHKLVFCRVDSEDEAHYLAAMVNCEPIQLLLASFLNEVGVAPATLNRLPIPAYDAAHPETRRLVSEARGAADAVKRGDPDALTRAEREANHAAGGLLRADRGTA